MSDDPMFVDVRLDEGDAVTSDGYRGPIEYLATSLGRVADFDATTETVVDGKRVVTVPLVRE